MRVKATSTFLKQLAALPDEVRTRVEDFAFDELPNIASLRQAPNVKKLQGYKKAYRARFGDYRVGIMLDGEVAVLRVVIRRDKMYKRFP